jgi:RNA polymerase sigma factor (sigma-70 family)
LAVLFSLARHDLTDVRCKQARSPGIAPLDEAALAVGADDSEELAIQRIQGDRVLAALRQLSPEQREVVLLRIAGGLTAPEVAATLGKTTGAVKALQHRGLASLARVLGVTDDTSSPESLPGSSEPARRMGQLEGR